MLYADCPFEHLTSSEVRLFAGFIHTACLGNVCSLCLAVPRCSLPCCVAVNTFQSLQAQKVLVTREPGPALAPSPGRAHAFTISHLHLPNLRVRARVQVCVLSDVNQRRSLYRDHRDICLENRITKRNRVFTCSPEFN